jgi:predicted PurR-regulated permease PerM
MAATAPLSRWDARRVVEASLAGAGVAALFLFLYRFRLVFLGAFVGVVLAAAVRPIVVVLARRGLRRDVGALLAFTVVTSCCLGVVVLVLPFFVDQLAAVVAKLPAYYADLRSSLFHSTSRVLRHLAVQLPSHFDLGGGMKPLAPNQILGFLESFVGGLLLTVSVVLFAFYWTIDGELGAQVLSRLAPLDRRDAARAFIAEAETRLGGYIRAQVFTCIAVGVMAFTAYIIIGVPNAIVFALFVSTMELVPVLGPTLGNAPAILVMLAVHPASALWVLLAAIVIQSIEAYVLFPRFMGKEAGVHPLTCLLALVAFGSLLGVLGCFLAIPIALLLQLTFERVVVKKDTKVVDVPSGRDVSDVLQYDARKLVADAHRLGESPAVIGDAALHSLTEEVEAIASELDRLLPERVRPNNEAEAA